MRARDVQLYVTNKHIQDLLVKARASGAVDVTPGWMAIRLTRRMSASRSLPRM